MNTLKIFIASSSELKEDRDDFRLFISQENDRLHTKGIYLELVQWENFLDAISDTRLQDEYNKAISDCDIVICLFFTKVGKYTAEEFDTAYQIFKDKGKPKIWTYFKNAEIKTGSITDQINTLLAFKKKLGDMGHFFTEYTNIDNLINKYRTQLDKFLPLYESGKLSNTATGTSPAVVREKVKNTFNELLPKRLIEAIRPYNKKANELISNYSDWETNADLKANVKRTIINGYVGVLGIQLRKLMSIGEEDFSESKMKRYLENCLVTSKRALQLIVYALFSKLWDHLQKNDSKISKAHSGVLEKYFKSATEESITGYANLLKTLIEIYSEIGLELPFPQLKELLPGFNTGSDLMQAISKTGAIADLLKNSSFSNDDCTEAEKNLIVILEAFNFLAEYKMISIKDINYALQRNDKEGLYMHNYTLLEGDSQANNTREGKVKNESTPVISYSVLLCKENNLRQNINLVPFVIDHNSLGLSGGTKICFFSFCNSFDDQSLNYSFIEDNSKIPLKLTNNPKPDEKEVALLNKWLAVEDNRKDMNYDNVYKMFHEAKKTLAGIEAQKIAVDDEL
jgi:hypothetical protein